MTPQRLPEPRFIRDNAPWLAAGMLLTFSSCFGQTYFISTFAGEIRAEFGLSHGQWGSIYGAGTLAAAMIMIWAGVLTDQFRVRVLGAGVLVMLAVACLSMATVPVGWMLLGVVMLLRLAGQGMCGHIATTAMARWFVATRGRALAVATMGFALAEATMPLLFVTLKEFVPWRGLWVLAACIVLAMIPVLLALLKRERTPQSTADDSHSPGMSGRHWTRGEAIRHPLFWYMMPALLGPPTFMTALFFHQVHLSELKGFTHQQFVSLFPIYTTFGILAMLCWGWLIDRFGSSKLMPLMQLPLAVSFTIMAGGESVGIALLSLMFLGITLGAMGAVPAAFIAEIYGTRHIGSIRAAAVAVTVFGSAVGPVLTGLLIDQGIGFEAQLGWIALYFILTSALLWFGIKRSAPTPHSVVASDAPNLAVSSKD
ncbi:MFS transporter [Qingshengfaniella alkalisoli]|uniref:MFS transporter n=1 Tax=Qingshengfaniella alkalisoli TaxID=2599296 RepID=A0A5B8J6B3_9RHOB|nr:MFS transporter [Qingshengfaniella alkalisoli]QDY69977.1 MFS transporter [Qingshengfaniella alkalisoli]